MARAEQQRAPGVRRRAATRAALCGALCLLVAAPVGPAPAGERRGPRLVPLERDAAPARGRGALRQRTPPALARLLASHPRAARASREAELSPPQREALRRLRERAPEAELRLRRDGGLPAQIKGRRLEPAAAGAPGPERDRATARKFLREQSALIGIDDAGAELEPRRWRRDRRGHSHLRFAQRHRGLRVWPAELLVHLDPSGAIELVDGAWAATPRSLATEASVPEAEALELARAAVPDGAAAAAAESELLVYAPGDRPARLAWRFELALDLRSQWRVLIDAQRGGTLLAYNRVASAAATGSGQDLQAQTRALDLWEATGTYYMVDTSKALLYDPSSLPPATSATRGAIIVLDAANQPPSATPAALPTVAQLTSADPDAWPVPASVSAAWGLSETYDYFLECHGRELHEDEGDSVVAIVRLGQGFDGAFWSSALGLMAFGDGEPLAGSLDVVGHEYLHGMIESEAQFIYQQQSGALSEAYADIFGELVAAHAVSSDPLCGDDPAPDWQVGSELSAPVRDLAAPGSLLMGSSGQPYPTRMSEYIQPEDPLLAGFPDGDNGGVHLNSVILSHAFYLLAEGLPGAIGLQPAADLFYQALTDHLVANSQFIDVRLATVAIAESSYGVGSPEALATAAAFDAVEIFDGPPTPPPPDFSAVLAADSTVYISFDSGSGLYFLDRRETFLGDPPTGSPLSLFDVRQVRPSVSGDGAEAWFVDSLDAVCVIETDPTLAEDCVDRGNPPTIPPATSVAVSPEGNYLAVVFDAQPENAVTITYRDPIDGWTATYTLEAPTVDGQAIANLLHPDVMDFAAGEQFLVFDALNELTIAGEGTVQVWSIYALDLTTGNLQDVIPPLAGFDFAYPSLGNTNNNLITFDAIDQVTGASTLFTGNLTTHQLVPVALLPHGAGVPSFTGDDSALIYTLVDGAGNTDLMRLPLQADHITPDGMPTAWLVDADFGVIYRRGAYDGPLPDRDLDTVANSVDNCPLEPNTSQDDVGGVGAGSPPDGIGDACQCGDLNRDGVVTDQDASDLRMHLLGLTPPGFALQLCSAIGQLECDLADAAVLLRSLQALAPGIAPVCAAAQP